MNIDGDIHFDDVSFHYPARKDSLILRNLTMVARGGKTTALVGSSGCGEYFRIFIDCLKLNVFDRCQAKRPVSPCYSVVISPCQVRSKLTVNPLPSAMCTGGENRSVLSVKSQYGSLLPPSSLFSQVGSSFCLAQASMKTSVMVTNKHPERQSKRQLDRRMPMVSS